MKARLLTVAMVCEAGDEPPWRPDADCEDIGLLWRSKDDRPDAYELCERVREPFVAVATDLDNFDF